MKILVLWWLACWFAGALVFTLSLCAAARPPVNRRTHRLGQWLARGGTIS